MTPHGPQHPAMLRHELRDHLEQTHGLPLDGYRWNLEELRRIHSHGHADADHRPAWVRRKDEGLLRGKVLA